MRLKLLDSKWNEMLPGMYTTQAVLSHLDNWLFLLENAIRESKKLGETELGKCYISLIQPLFESNKSCSKATQDPKI